MTLLMIALNDLDDRLWLYVESRPLLSSLACRAVGVVHYPHRRQTSRQDLDLVLSPLGKLFEMVLELAPARHPAERHVQHASLMSSCYSGIGMKSGLSDRIYQVLSLPCQTESRLCVLVHILHSPHHHLHPHSHLRRPRSRPERPVALGHPQSRELRCNSRILDWNGPVDYS